MENYNYIPAFISRIAVPCMFLSGTLHKLFLYEFVNIYDTMKREINDEIALKIASKTSRLSKFEMRILIRMKNNYVIKCSLLF